MRLYKVVNGYLCSYQRSREGLGVPVCGVYEKIGRVEDIVEAYYKTEVADAKRVLSDYYKRRTLDEGL